MQTKKYTETTGKIRTFHIKDEIGTLVKLDKSKPSTLIIRTKKGKKAIAALGELEKNHNHSWYKELRARVQKNPNGLALYYRGTRITFKEMIERADMVAEALVHAGIKKGDEVPACLSNTPELVYILLAINKIGAKINLFGTHLDESYLNEILDGCTNKLFICTDDSYEKIKSIVGSKDYKNKVMISLCDSLPSHPETLSDYEPTLSEYYHYPNRTLEFKKQDSRIMTFDEFLKTGDYNKIPVIDDNDLDTEFLVTYTSGSTKIGRPKQIVHNNRSMIVCGRFHDSELSGNPELKGIRGLAHIHTDSNTNIITCISDNLMQLWSVALEPEYDKEKALDYVMLNKPNYLNATTSFIIEMAKQYLIDKKYHENGIGRKLDFLFATFAVGEGTSKGEEKFINTFLRKSRAGSGVKVSGLSLPFTTLSVGGGDCEHGGIYYSLWRSLYEKIHYLKLSKREYGLMPVPYAQVSAFKLNKDGIYEECNFNEYGLIAANSATTMVRYKDNSKATSDLIITDNLGRDWVSSNVYGYIDELGGVHVKGRVNNEILFRDGTVIPTFKIEDVVNRDTKNILSCSVTQVMCDDEIIPIINIEYQPLKEASDIVVLNSILNRCATEFSSEMIDKCAFRVFDNEKSFPLTGSGKRSIRAIEEMGLQNVFRISDGQVIPVKSTNEFSKQKVLTLNTKR